MEKHNLIVVIFTTNNHGEMKTISLSTYKYQIFKLTSLYCLTTGINWS